MKTSLLKKGMSRIMLTALMALFLAAGMNAQNLDMDKLKDMEPRNIGPAGMSGRITAIDVVTDNPDVIYSGAASGGLWKSESGGVDWKPIFDDQEVHSIGAIDIYQKNPSIVWVGTGEGNPRNSATMGGGVYRSIDGGRSWEYMGLKETRTIHRIIVHPENPDVVYVGAQGNPWGDTEARGVYKTTDGGKTWEKILYNNDRTGVADLVMDPSNPNKLFAAMWEYRRWPWFFESGGEGSGLYRSMDGGESWTEITADDGLAKGPLGRIGLAIAPSNPDRVYAWVESKNNALYRSDDGGYSWEKTVEMSEDSDMGNRPFYYADIYVDPQNENRVYSLYSFLSVSQDGGKSFESIYPYYNYIHPDHHAFYIHPEDPSFLIDGNDGGMNISHDRGESWRFIENIPVAQYYHINVDMQYPYNVYGGMQDNGSWQGPAYIWRQGGIRNSYFQELYFGDGFDVVIDSSDARYAYAMSQQGNVGRVDLETGHSRFSQPVNPEGEELRFNWNAPIALDPFDDKTVYFGSQFVHKSTNQGDSWSIISPDLTTNDTTKQKQHKSGGLTYDATGAENYTTLTAIAPSRLQDQIIWAGSDDGNVHVSRNDGESWTKVSDNFDDVAEGSWVTQIKTSRYNEGEAIVVLNDYRRNNWAPYVMRTTDYGDSWENIVEGKGLEGYALSFVQDPVEPNLMFTGTELGLYVSIDGGEHWTKWTNGYPTASTYDMVIHPREHDLVIGTFGRAAWVLDDIRPLRELARKGTEELDKKVNVYPAPDAYLASTFQASGTRFAGDAIFKGENRPMGARLTYSVVKDESSDDGETDKKKKEQKVTIEIYDNAGGKIRTFEDTPEHNGINRTTWGLREKGVRGPSRRMPKENAPEPAGPEVLPGKYKVKMTYGEQSDSTTVQVHFDPRIEYDINDLKAVKEMQYELMSLRGTAAEATNHLLEAKEMIQTAENLIADAKKAESISEDRIDSLEAETKAVQDSVKSLLNFVLGEEDDDKQGIVRNPEPTVVRDLWAPSSYLRGAIGGPTQKEKRLMEKARGSVEEAVTKINSFFETEWPVYIETMDKAELSPFKQFKSVEF
ncbi:WD40/YVTN/BNR-like repeat-containing protein [Fodinibius halophilus]|nr:hypothetical protein [Fodinibius halophilus]